MLKKYVVEVCQKCCRGKEKRKNGRIFKPGKNMPAIHTWGIIASPYTIFVAWQQSG